MVDVVMPEPEFMEESGKLIVKPTVKISIGQYLLVGSNIGIVFPSVPFGPKGAKLANALNKLLQMIMDERFEPIMNGFSEATSKEDIAQVPVLMQELGEMVTVLYEEGLKLNYDQQTVAWILDNMPVDMKMLKKLLAAVQGASVDAEFFPGQRD